MNHEHLLVQDWLFGGGILVLSRVQELPALVPASMRISFVCVCVHPWTKGSQPTSAGGDRVAAWLSPTKLHAVDQDAGTDHPRVPALLTFAHAVQSFGLFSWCFMSSSPQTGFSATFSSRAFLQLVAAVVHKPLVKTSSIDRTPHLTVEPFLSSGN